MIREERMQEIVAHLNQNGGMTAAQLSKCMYVSLSTVYRDLQDLITQKLVYKTSGDTFCLSAENVAAPFDYRWGKNVEIKKILGREASKLVTPGSTIFIDSSTTAASIIHYLDKSDGLTVMTNAFSPATHLRIKGIRTIFVGGLLVENAHAVDGRLLHTLQGDYHIDTFFFSTHGVMNDGSIVDSSKEETDLRRNLLRIADTCVFMCDRTKFGNNSYFRVTEVKHMDYVITDAPLPDPWGRPRKEAIVVNR